MKRISCLIGALVLAVVAAAQQTTEVKLSPLGIVPGGGCMAGGRRNAKPRIGFNLALLERVAGDAANVRKLVLLPEFEAYGGVIEVMARGECDDGAKVDFASCEGLQKVRLEAGDRLVFAAWKMGFHENGGASLSGLTLSTAGGGKQAYQGRAESGALGSFTYCGLGKREKFPLIAQERTAAAGKKPGEFVVESSANITLNEREGGVLYLHTNGRTSHDEKFDCAPALVFTAKVPGEYSVAGSIALRVSKAGHQTAWLAGRWDGTVGAGTLGGEEVALHRALRPEVPGQMKVMGVDYDAAPLVRIRLTRGASERPQLAAGAWLQSYLDGSWENHGLVVCCEGGKGVRLPSSFDGLATVVEEPKHVLFDAPVKIRAGAYVTMKDGQLWYDGQRLRLWSTVKDGTGARYRQLGYNGWRAWYQDVFYTPASAKRGEVMKTLPGQDSPLDRYDRMFADMKTNDVFVMFATLVGLGMEPSHYAQKGSFMHKAHGTHPNWQAWCEALERCSTARTAELSYVDDWLWEVRLRHAWNVLNHLNPYTGKKYAEEEAIALVEINNEAQLVKGWVERGFGHWPEFFRKQLQQRWHADLLKQYGTHAKLAAAWGKELAAGESWQNGKGIGLTGGDAASQRRRDLQRFLMDVVRERDKQYIEVCRSNAPKGIGVNVVPFSCDSMYRPSIPWAYQNWCGDSSTVSMYFWANGTMLASPPGLYVLDSHRLDGKLSVIYETGRGRPSRYRTETPYMLSVLTDWQDFDIVSWHGSWIGKASNEQLLAGGVEPPAKSHFWNAVHLEHDPAMTAAVAMAGRLYLNGIIGQAKNPYMYTLGEEAVFGTEAWNGIGGTDMSHRVFTRGARIRLEADKKIPMQIDGKAPQPLPAPTGAVQTGEYAVWDWQNERLIIDAPSAKVYVGKTCADYTFKDGLVLSGFNTPWIAFSIISQDGKPLTACSKAWVSAVYDAKNTGFEYDYSVSGGPVEQAAAVKNKGIPPVISDKVAYTLSFPKQVLMQYAGYDFALRQRQNKGLGRTNVLRMPPQDDWMGVVTFSDWRGTAAAIKDPSPGAVQAKAVGAARTLPSERTDAKLVGFWCLVPELSWGDSYARAHRTLRDAAFLKGSITPEDTTANSAKQITVQEARIVLQQPGTLEIKYAGEQLREIALTFDQAPTYGDVEALITQHLGKPLRQNISPTADTQSETEWQQKLPAGTLQVLLTEVQGVSRILCKLSPMQP